MTGPRAVTRNRLSAILRENGLSLVLALIFIATMIGQFGAGYVANNESRAEHGLLPLSTSEYAKSGAFWEATSENWESEFLQMGAFVLLTVKLKQKGSSESKPMDEPDESEEDPNEKRLDQNAPWPVRKGGVALMLYRRSLTIALFTMFIVSFALHVVSGTAKSNAERSTHGKPPESILHHMGSAEFWFESLQNWQSEFLAVFAIIVLSIFLRQQGSPQSKPVAAPHLSDH